MKKLSILIPAYNEEKTVRELIKRVKQVDFSELENSVEILVINDCSTDSTLDIMKSIDGVKVLSHPINRGKGGAVKTGIKHATGDVIIVQDADLECDPEDIKHIAAPILRGEEKVVYGSRYLLQKEKKDRPFGKPKNALALAYLGGRLVTWMTNLLFFSNITDEPTCYKCFDANLIRSIEIDGDGFEWEPEITAKVLKRKIKIKEVPMSYFPRTTEEGKKVNWKDGVRAIWTLFKYRVID